MIPKIHLNLLSLASWAKLLHRGVWSSGLGWWCTRCAKCEIQGSSSNMDSLGLLSLAAQGSLVSFIRLESYDSSWPSYTQQIKYYYDHVQIRLPSHCPFFVHKNKKVGLNSSKAQFKTFPILIFWAPKKKNQNTRTKQ